MKLPRWIGAIVCAFKGHKRGKLVRTEGGAAVRILACPRCGRETRYQVKVPA